MKILINGKEIELHYSLRMFVLYENIMQKSLNPEDMQFMNNMIALFYSAVQATCTKLKIEYTATYEEFIDFIDENGGQTYLAKFAEWMNVEAKKQSELCSKIDYNKDEDKKKVKKSRKNS